MITAENISKAILDLLHEKLGSNDISHEQMDAIRRGVGLTLSALHTTMLHGPDDREEKIENVKLGMDSVMRLVASLQNDVRELKLGEVAFQFGEPDFRTLQ